MTLNLGEIEWINETKVKVPWSSYISGLNATANIATLELQNGIWVVTETKITAVS